MISMTQSGFQLVDQQRILKLSAREFCLTCTIAVFALYGCSKPAPEAPVLTHLRQKAAEPLEPATNVTGTLFINGEESAPETVPEFKPQSKLKVTVDINFNQPGITETAGLIKCVRTVNGKKVTGSSAGLNFPTKDFEFELPLKQGEWDLLIVNSQNGLICSQRINVVQ